jgi:metal-sulfur cluster biosynthetic enzyme
MSEIAPKKKVGRPKKSPSIHPSKFIGIANKPLKCGTVEWTYTEIKTFNNIMKTLKSCEVEITFDPPWSKDLMSEEAKLELGML